MKFTVNTNKINQNYGVPFQASVVSNANNLLVVPGTITILPGTHSYTFTIIPINGFLGGSVNMSIIGTIIKDKTTINCSTRFKLNVTACNSNQARSATTEDEDFATFKNEGDLMLYPNPATNKVNIRFESAQTQSQIEVYDLTGRLMASFESSAKEGVWELDLAPMATGVYVVVLRQNNQIVMQRKLQVL